MELDPERIQASLSRDQYRLYKLFGAVFWPRKWPMPFMTPCRLTRSAAGICLNLLIKAKLCGFIAVYEEGKDEEVEAAGSPLPDLQEGDQASIRSMDKQQHFTQPPARYTEAMLVKAMEEKGVGRPSTYASIISTIQDRDYVIKKDKRLAPTPLGEVVNGLMMERFNDIIDVEFTANMENRLDDVEEGKRHWQDILRDFYKGFHQEMEDAEEALKDTRLKVPDEETDEVCELCGRKMVIKMGRFGRFMACPGYPECKNTKPIVERMPGRCPKCGSGMLKRKSKKGFAYYACERGAACGFMTWDVPTEFDCPSCGQTMFKKSGRGRMKPFCINEACSNFSRRTSEVTGEKQQSRPKVRRRSSRIRLRFQKFRLRIRNPKRKRPERRRNLLQRQRRPKRMGRHRHDGGKGHWRRSGRLRGGLAVGRGAAYPSGWWR